MEIPDLRVSTLNLMIPHISLSSDFRSRRGSVDESYEWDSAYVPMHPVDPKVSGLQSQEKKISSTKDYSRPYLDLKQKGKRNACSVYHQKCHTVVKCIFRDTGKPVLSLLHGGLLLL